MLRKTPNTLSLPSPIEKWERAQKVSLFVLSANGSPFFDSLRTKRGDRRTLLYLGLLVLTCAWLLASMGISLAEEMVQIAGNHPAGILGAPTGQIAPDRMLTMTITLKIRDPEGLNRLLAEQQ